MTFGFEDLLKGLANGGLTANTGGGSQVPVPYANTPAGITAYANKQYPTPIKTIASGGPTQQTTQAPVQQGGGDPAGADLALQAFNVARQQASDFRNRGQDTFNTILKSIQDFRDRSNTNFTNAGQEITDNSSNILGTNANNAQQLVGKSTGQARSLGLGLSSRANLGQSILNNLGTTQGSVLAKTGEQNAANRADLAGNLATADTKASENNNYLQSVNDAANNVESAGVNNYGSALNGILNFQRSIAALNSSSAANLTPDFSGIQNTLSGILGGNGIPSTTTAGVSNPSTTASANPVTLNPFDAILAEQRKKQQGLVN